MSAFRYAYARRKNRYNAKSADGFGSKLEKSVYIKLRDREILGEIRDIKRQQTVVLVDGPKNSRITWRLDFSFVDCKTGELIYAEAKGFPTREYQLKLKLWRNVKPFKLELWKGTYRRPMLAEVIEK